MTEVRHQVRVACDPQQAFRTFTRRVDAWWPRAHRTLGRDSRMQLEAGPQGRLLERLGEQQRVWGQVLTWAEGELLELVWCMGGLSTLVRVSFTADDGGTVVAVRHTPGPSTAEQFTSRADRFAAGWTAVLGSLHQALAG